MENPFSLKEMWMGYWAWNSLLEDPFNFFSELRNFDMYAGWCDSPSAMDQMLAFDGMPSFPSTSYPSRVQKVLQNKLLLPLLDKINASGTSYNGRDNGVLQQTNSYCGYPSDSIDADDLGAKHSSGAGPQNCF
uniref:Uncharacterized protein n=1 Tax=Populus trichocarpa TaxID=3694 RepID=A0A2K1R7M9_POPTR